MSDDCLTLNEQFLQVYHGENKLHFNVMMYDVRFVLDQHADLDFYSASSLKQQSADRHVTPLGHKQIKQNKTKWNQHNP
jgi:hypothetical protein